MLKMEDSGIDSDSKSNSNGGGGSSKSAGPSTTAYVVEYDVEDSELSTPFISREGNSSLTTDTSWDVEESTSSTKESSAAPTAKLISTSQLQKRLEKQILQAKRIRLKEQSLAADGLPKKLIPRNRLKVPKTSQMPTVTKADSHPLVSWESDSENDEFDFLPTSKAASREITQQLIKDGYNLDLTPDDEDLDLIPPKSLDSRCICCGSVSSLCVIQ